MTGTRATITMGVDGAPESRRNIDSVADAMRRMNAESLAGISGQVGALNDRISGLQSRIGDIASFSIAGVSLGMLTGKVGDALDKFGDLDDMAQRTGASIENLSRLQKVAEAFGADFGTVGTALANLNKGLSGADEESSKTRKALAFLGISARDSAGKLREPGELMIEIANRLQGYKDGAGKAALANDLFGKSGRDLLPYMGDVSESIDKFSATAEESVRQATALQDQWGMLRVRSNELFTGIVVAGLPAMSNLAGGISDVMKSQNKLATSKDSGWAEAMAMGAARVVDVLMLIPRIASAVGSSFKVVGADLEYLATTAVELAKLGNPAHIALKYAKGEDPLKGIKAALADRNKVVAEANAEYARLMNQPANQVEQAVMARFSDRKGGPKVPKAPEPDKPPANYSTGKDSDAEAADKAAEAYRNLTASIQAKIKQSQIEANTGKAATAVQQERLRVDEQLTKLNLEPKQRAFVEGLLQELEATNAVIESNKRAAAGRADWDKIQQQWLDSNVKVLADATEEAARNEALARTFGMTKGAIEQTELARLKDQLAQRSSLGLTLEEIEHLENLIAAKERSAAALGSVDAAEAAKKAGEELDKFLDPTKAQTFGEALKGAFGAAGDSLTQLISNLDAYGIRQAEIDKARKDAAMRYSTDSKGYAAASEAISSRELRSRVTAYGDMATAAKGFFSAGSKGYHTLEAAEKAFRAYELAMAGEALVKKLFFKEAEVAAHTTLNATKLTGEAASTAASTGLAATEASAWGITAVVKAIASLPFPLNLAAGAATMAAVVAVGAKMLGGVGGSSVSMSQSRQESQGTGSVFGDSDAKSESIARSLERVEDNTYQGLAISMGMLNALTEIKGNIGSFAALVVRDTNITGKASVSGLGQGSAEEFWSSGKATFLQGGPFGILLDKITGGWLSKTTGKIMGAIFGGKATLEDSGFTVDKATLGAIADGGLSAMSYAEIKKDGGWFRKDRTSTKTTELGGDANRQISKVLLSLSDSVIEAGIALGLPADSFAQKLDGFVVDIGKISFKDMKADEIEKTLQAVFSKLGDSMAQFAVGGLEQFQQVGEGYMETLVRIAQGYQSVDVVMQSMGMTFGAVGIDSIAARQRVIELSGGLEKFVQNSEQFLNDFFTEQEQADALKARVQPILGQYGLKASGEDASKQFRDYLVALNPSTDAGAKAYAVLSQIAPALKQIADAEQYIYDERKDLQAQLDELTMTSAQALAKQRDALHESNRALFDQVQAATKAAAVLDERKELQEQLDELTMTSAQALAKQRDALHESNQALFDQVQAATSAKDVFTSLQQALEKISSARGGIAEDLFNAVLGGKDLNGKISQLKKAEEELWSKVGKGGDDVDLLAKIKAFAMQRIGVEDQLQDEAMSKLMEQHSTRKGVLADELAAMTKLRDYVGDLREFADGLKLGNLSALSPQAQLEEAAAQYRKTLGLAQGGDAAAQGNLQGIAQSYLQLSKQFYGSTNSYASTFASVIGDIERFAAPAESEFAAVQQQINVINDMSSSLGKTVRDTSERQVAVLTKIDGVLQKSQESTEAQLRQSAAANAALTEEIGKLTKEVKEIRSELALVGANK